MRVQFTQTVTVDCNDWEGLIRHLNADGWTDFFFSLDCEDEEDIKSSKERLARDIGIQAIHTSDTYTNSLSYKFIEGFGKFYRVDDPWSTGAATYVHQENGFILVIQEQQDEAEAEDEDSI